MTREHTQEPDLAGARWRKSSFSQNAGACVEVAPLPGAAGVRDSKRRAADVLVSGRRGWDLFVGAVKRGSLHSR